MFPLRILIVANSIDFLESAAHLLELRPEVQSVRCAVSVSDALDQLPSSNPNVVLVSWNLSGTSGLTLTQLLKSRISAPYVFLLSMFDLPIYHTVAKEAGADGLICASDWNVELFALLDKFSPSTGVRPGSPSEQPTQDKEPAAYSENP